MFRKEKLQLKKRKNAALKVLLLSVFVTFMCLSMLVGTTYAWLTDSVTSGRNTIISGTLDVELNYYNGDQGKWVLADNDVFENITWEPGAMFTRVVQIKNNGDIPIKFAFKANIPEEYGSINTQNAQFFLSQSIKVLQETYDTSAAAIDAMQNTTDLTDRINSVADFGFGGFTQLTSDTEGEEIAAGGYKYVLLAITMPTSSVEVSTTKAGMPAPKFDIQLVVMAVKGTSQDAFGNTAEDTVNTLTATIDSVKYPLDATKLLYKKTENNNEFYVIENVEDFYRFASVVNSGVDFAGDTVKLMADIELGDNVVWPLTGNFDGAFDGNGKTISKFKFTVNETDGHQAQYATLFNGATSSINNLNVTDIHLTRHNTDQNTDTNVHITSIKNVMSNGTISVA